MYKVDRDLSDAMKKRILITGGSGLLAVNWALWARDHYLVTLGLNNRQISLDGVETSILNFASYDALSSQIASIQPDIIVHTAGLTNVEACEQDPLLANEVNVVLAANIARIASMIKCKLVHISTDHLFTGEHPNVDESAVPAPVNMYGITKYQAEIKVLENAPGALIIRTNFYGWGPGYRSSFSDMILKTLRAGKQINLFTDVFFTPILIQSLVPVVHQLIDKECKGIFNVVGSERISKFAFGMLTAHEFGLDPAMINPIHFADKTGLTKRPLDLSISNKKVCRELAISIGDVAGQLAILHTLESEPGIVAVRNLAG